MCSVCTDAWFKCMYEYTKNIVTYLLDNHKIKLIEGLKFLKIS